MNPIIPIIIPIVTNIIAIVIGYIFITRRYIPKLIQNVLNDVGENLSESIKEIFVNPTVKKGFTLAANLGGEAVQVKAVEKKLAEGALDTQLGGLKIIAKQVLGIDIDEMVEEYGATAVLQAANNFLPMLKGFIPGQNVKKSYDPLA